MNTNGENFKNNRKFAYGSLAKIPANRFTLNPSRPAAKANMSVERLVTTVRITIQTKNIYIYIS
jgi:hypothetical protein